jgi:hypothetical protein
MKNREKEEWEVITCNLLCRIADFLHVFVLKTSRKHNILHELLADNDKESNEMEVMRTVSYPASIIASKTLEGSMLSSIFAWRSSRNVCLLDFEEREVEEDEVVDNNGEEGGEDIGKERIPGEGGWLMS